MKTIDAGYIMHSTGGRRLLAAPAELRWARLSGVKRFHPFTIKRRFIQNILYFMAAARIDHVLGRRLPPDFELAPGLSMDRWLRVAGEHIDLQDTAPIITWPPQIDRGRSYVHLLLPGDESAGFAKVSHDYKNDIEIRREADTLQALKKHQIRTARIPSVLARFCCGGHETVIQEGFPFSAEPTPVAWSPWHDAFIEEYGGPVQLLGREDLEDEPWWQTAMNAVMKHERIMREVDALGRVEGLPVRRVHGDFGPANVLQSGDQIWVVDWESSAARGPALTDPLWFAIGRRARLIRKRPEQAMQSLFDAFASGDERADRRDILAALVYLLGAGYAARVGPLADAWPKEG